jgi:hypothetical protein
MAYIGNELMTEFSKINLPVYDISDEIPDSLLSSLETIGIGSAREGLVVPRGSPKYANGRDSTLQSKVLARVVT